MQHKPLETGFYGVTHNLKIQVLQSTGLGFNTGAGTPNGIWFTAKVYRSGNALYGLLINSSHNFDLYSKTTNQ